MKVSDEAPAQHKEAMLSANVARLRDSNVQGQETEKLDLFASRFSLGASLMTTAKLRTVCFRTLSYTFVTGLRISRCSGTSGKWDKARVVCPYHTGATA